MICPRCGEGLENYSDQEGGWCPSCGEWYPADLCREIYEIFLEEKEEAENTEC